MMADAIEVYLNSEESSKELNEDGDSSLTEVQEKFNQLQERYVTLKTMAESLKEQISLEKEEWRKEIKNVVEAQMGRNSRHDCEANVDEGYKRKVELFRDFVFFQRASSNLESLTWKHNYQNWLTEVENKCNLELVKIKESITILKPLKEVAAKWGKQELQRERKCTCGASGDASGDEVETVPVKETNELKIDEN